VPQTPIIESLKDESRGGTSGAQSGLRNLVVVGEIALSTILLVGGGLLLQSLRTLLQQSPGFEPQHLLTFDVNLPGLSYPTGKEWPFDNTDGLRFTKTFLERLRRIPGVTNVSATNGLPVTENRSTNRFIVEGKSASEAQDEACITRRIDSDYFNGMKIPLIAGRYFSPADNEAAPKVAIVNQAWVKNFLAKGEEPLGKQVRLASPASEPFRQIVGVIGDVAEDSLAVQPPPVMYFPLDQGSGFTRYLRYVMRTTSDPSSSISSVRVTLRELDPQLALIQPQSMDQLVNLSPAVFLRRYPLYLMGCFAALALALATIGLYGLISYSVLRRTREIGIRLALGARREDVLRLILRQGLIAALAGIALGLVGALGATRIMGSMLYGIHYGAWTVFGVVATLLLLITLTASYVPARRATKVDPIIALRNE
jgi:putative ABC transport system permease protein